MWWSRVATMCAYLPSARRTRSAMATALPAPPFTGMLPPSQKSFCISTTISARCTETLSRGGTHCRYGRSLRRWADAALARTHPIGTQLANGSSCGSSTWPRLKHLAHPRVVRRLAHRIDRPGSGPYGQGSRTRRGPRSHRPHSLWEPAPLRVCWPARSSRARAAQCVVHGSGVGRGCASRAGRHSLSGFSFLALAPPRPRGRLPAGRGLRRGACGYTRHRGGGREPPRP